jgi:hypothetical protein
VAIVTYSLPNVVPFSVPFRVWSVRIAKAVLILGTEVWGMPSGWAVVEFIKRLFPQ